MFKGWEKICQEYLWHMKMICSSNVRVYKQSSLGAQPRTFVHTSPTAFSMHFCDLLVTMADLRRSKRDPGVTQKPKIFPYLSLHRSLLTSGEKIWKQPVKQSNTNCSLLWSFPPFKVLMWFCSSKWRLVSAAFPELTTEEPFFS